MSTQHLWKHWATLMLSLTLSTEAFASRGDIHTLYKGQSVDDMVMQYMEEHQVPGLSVAIVQAPYITRVIGYGIADRESKRLAGSRTAFPVGQMSTAYTAVAIMQLVEAGKIKLTDTINQYLPTLPKAWETITIRELLTHSSGLPSYTESQGFDYTKPYDLANVLALTEKQPLRFASGSDVAPSSTNYYLLAEIIEKASGMSYEAFVTKNQFERMGLKHTYFLSTIKDMKNEIGNKTIPFKHSAFKHEAVYVNPTEVASGYTEKDGKLIEASTINPRALSGYATVVSTAEEVSVWDIGLAGDILVKDSKNREFLYNSVLLDQGKKKVPANVGWQFPGHPGLMYIEGNIPGFSSHLSRYTAPTELLCVTILANKDNLPDLDILARQIAGAYDAKLAAPEPSPWAVTRQSPYSVDETLNRLRQIVLAGGGTVFTEIDHAEHAFKAKQTLTPTKVLVIGNPSKGTGLMQAENGMALDLPLRVAAWKDEKSGAVWVSYTDPLLLGKQYGMEKQEALLKQMRSALSMAVKKAITPGMMPGK